MVVVRSIVYQILFYLNLGVLLVLALPALLISGRSCIAMAKLWGRSSLWLLQVICGTKIEIRGLEKVPRGPLIVAAKHQSTWETFVLPTLFDYPVFVVKRELMWVPIFGWLMWRAGMISVDRGSRSAALASMTIQARERVHRGRQLFIFPEGTRRAAGAEPAYKFGVAHLYAEIGVPCVPVALNSGLFWPRRSFLRHPGTIIVEFLDPIPPGLDKQTFFRRLQDEIEAATARLVAEGQRDSGKARRGSHARP